MSTEIENHPKRIKTVDNFPAIQPGSQVRLVNLPAHPGLEGVVATVLSIDEDNFVEVEIRKTSIVKKVKRDKVRPILVGCIVELHGLVSAYKLNGRIGECIAFDDEELFRYSVLLSDGVTKKVKPENVRFIAKYDSQMVTKYQVESMLESMATDPSLRDRIDILSRANRIVPDAISVRVLLDYLKLDSEELREKLLQSKRVSVLSLVGSDVKILYVSLPRSRLISSGIGDRGMMKIFRQLISSMNGVEKFFNTQVYLILPFLINQDMGLPMIDRSVHCSYPLFPFVADATVLVLEKEDKLESLNWPSQRMDLWLSNKVFNREVFVFQEDGGSSRSWKKSMAEIRIRSGLPSRGRISDDDNLVREIEKSLEMVSPATSSGWVDCMLIN